MATDRTPRVQVKPLADAVAVEEVTARSKARRTGHLLLTNGTHRPGGDTDVRLNGGLDLCGAWSDRDRIEKGATEVHRDRNVHHHRRAMGLTLEGVQNPVGRACVPEVPCEDMVAGLTVEKSNGLEKCTIGCEDVLKKIENREVAVVLAHMGSCRDTRKSLSVKYK